MAAENKIDLASFCRLANIEVEKFKEWWKKVGAQPFKPAKADRVLLSEKDWVLYLAMYFAGDKRQPPTSPGVVWETYLSGGVTRLHIVGSDVTLEGPHDDMCAFRDAVNAAVARAVGR